ncbi:MAG TPA: HPr family phosphocarrier protein [Cellulomonas sp.]
MTTRTVTIASRSGLHARPAAIFAQAAGSAGVPVTIAPVGGAPVDASSVLRVMALGLGHGAEVELSADGPDAEPALDRLAALLATDLDAPAGQQ